MRDTEEYCLVCGAPADEADGICPLGDEDEGSDEWEEEHCLALELWWAGVPAKREVHSR